MIGVLIGLGLAVVIYGLVVVFQSKTVELFDDDPENEDTHLQ